MDCLLRKKGPREQGGRREERSCNGGLLRSQQSCLLGSQGRKHVRNTLAPASSHLLKVISLLEEKCFFSYSDEKLFRNLSTGRTLEFVAI